MKRIKFLVSILVLMCVFLGGIGISSAQEIQMGPGNIWRGPYIPIATEDNLKWLPQVAYNSQYNEYMVVWVNVDSNGHHSINGRRVTSKGDMSIEFPISSGVNNSNHPDIAYDPALNRYLVVWSYDYTGDASDLDIYGRFIHFDGPYDDEPEFPIDNARTRLEKPRVEYSPISAQYMVIWRQLTDEFSSDYAIAGGIIRNDKTGLPFQVSMGPETRDFPEITYNYIRNQFVVVWDQDMSGIGQALNIHARILDVSGAPVTEEFTVTNSPSNEQHPSIASCKTADQYLIVWQQQVDLSPDDNIYGRMMSGNGDLQQAYDIAGTSLPQDFPRVACNPAGSEYMLVWSEMYAQPYPRIGVWGEIIQTNFHVWPSFEVARPSDTSDRRFPAVSYGKDTALVVWQSGRENPGILDIWGQLNRPHMVFMPQMRK